MAALYRVDERYDREGESLASPSARWICPGAAPCTEFRAEPISANVTHDATPGRFIQAAAVAGAAAASGASAAAISCGVWYSSTRSSSTAAVSSKACFQRLIRPTVSL